MWIITLKARYSILLCIIFIITLSISGISAVNNNDNSSNYMEPHNSTTLETNNTSILSNESTNHTRLDENNIAYVSLNGSDTSGDGSNNNPYQSLDYAINHVGNNSTIYLFDGSYNINGLTIDKDLTIKSINGNVVINGSGKFIFNVKENSNLLLESVNIIDGHGDANTESSFYNRGNLTIIKCTLTNNTGFVSGISNYGTLTIKDSTLDLNKGENYEDIVNYGNLYANNSNIYRNTIYNFGNIDLNYCNIQYGLISNTTEGGKPSNLRMNNTILIRDSYSYFEILNSNGIVENSKIYGSESLYRIYFYNSNITISSSLFESIISLNGLNNLTISYSLLYKVYSDKPENEKFVDISNNWWQINEIPEKDILNSFKPKTWIIANFTSETPLNKGENNTLMVTLHLTDGKNVWDIPKNIKVTDINVRFECENGKFSPNSGIIRNNIFKTKYSDNTEETVIYAIINKERLSLLIGKGYTNYSIYVSTTGHDGTGDGSKENPYETLTKAVSKALNGNTIYIDKGIYDGYYNSLMNINKNINFKAYNGPVYIETYESNYIFKVPRWARLSLEGINFYSKDKSFSNTPIISSAGTININNCTFKNILSEYVVYVSEDYFRYGNLNINNTLFSNIDGCAIYGAADLNINNSNFTGFNPYGTYYQKKTIITTNNNLVINNTLFTDSTVPAIYSGSNNAGGGNLIINHIIIENSEINNVYGNTSDNYYNKLPVISFDKYCANPIQIKNCRFIKNPGTCIKGGNCNIVNSSFISNYGDNIIINDYYNFKIYNSTFINNTNNYTGLNYNNLGTIFNGGTLDVENSTFINNSASYGGAIYNTKTTNIKYSIFINNTAKYLGNDLFNKDGMMNASSNWWGSNQGPTSDKAYRFLGDLILDNWIVMTLNIENYTGDNYTVKVSLNKLTNPEGEVFDSESSIPDSRIAYFNCTHGSLDQKIVPIINGTGYTTVYSNLKDNDAIVYVNVDNQILDLRISNRSTKILIDDNVVYGDKQIINISLININGYKIANQTLFVSFINSTGENQGTYRLDCNDTGSANLELNFKPDLYQVIVRYDGDNYFKSSNATASLRILISSTNLIGYNQIYYGKNNDFYVILKDSFNNPLMNKKIYFDVNDGKNHYAFSTNTDPSGRADIQLSIEPGKYEIASSFKGDSWYTASGITLNVTIYATNTKIIATDKILYGYGDIYSFKLLDNENNPIKGESVELTIKQGNISQSFKLITNDEANAEIAINLLPGVYNITASYKGSQSYSPTKVNAKITVEKVISRINSDLNINLTKTDGLIQIKLIDLYMRAITNQTVSITIYMENQNYTINTTTDEEGIGYIKTKLNPGDYQGMISYLGNNWYYPTVNGISLTKDLESNKTSNIKLNGTDFKQYYGENKYFNISLIDPNAKTLNGKNIVVSIIGKSSYKTYNLTTDIDGIVRLKIELEPGNYNITYKYDNIYYGIHETGKNSITILKTPTRIIGENITIKYNSGELYEITLKDINNNLLKNKRITVNLDSVYGNKKYNLTTDSYGIARLKTNLNIGEYYITMRYTGDNRYFNSINTSKLIIKKPSSKISTRIISTDMKQEFVYYRNGERGGYFKVILKDKNGKILKNKKVQFLINNKKYIKTTDSKGVAKLQINLEKIGTYTISIGFLSDSKYDASFARSKITITKKSTKISTNTNTYKLKTKSKYITVTLKDKKGKVIKGKKLKFTINGKTYTATTDKKGVAKIKVTLNQKKTYKYSVIFSGDGKYYKTTGSSKIKVI